MGRRGLGGVRSVPGAAGRENGREEAARPCARVSHRGFSGSPASGSSRGIQSIKRRSC